MNKSVLAWSLISAFPLTGTAWAAASDPIPAKPMPASYAGIVGTGSAADSGIDSNRAELKGQFIQANNGFDDAGNAGASVNISDSGARKVGTLSSESGASTEKQGAASGAKPAKPLGGSGKITSARNLGSNWQPSKSKASIVAGQAALLKSEWNFLSAGQISDIIIQTATRSKGADAKLDPVYTVGQVNIAKSLSPIGNITTPVNGKKVSLGGAMMMGITGVPSSTPVMMTGVDNYGRGYSVDVSRKLQSSTSQGITSTTLFTAADRQAELVDKVTEGVNGGSNTLSYSPDGSAVALSQRDSAGTVFAFGAGNMSGKFFGLEASGLAPLELQQSGKFNAPYYAMVKDASHAGISFVVGSGSRFRFGALSENGAAVEPMGPSFNEHNKRFLSSAEFEQKMGRAVGILTVGMLRETGSMLGSQQSQALALHATPTTTFTSASVGYALSPRSALVAMASYGKTAAFGNDSLISQLSAVRTVAYSMGYSNSEIFSKHDRLGLTFSVPVKVRSGSMQLSGPVAQSSDSGALTYGTQTLNLKPTATERDMEMTYSSTFGKDGKMGKMTGAVMFRVNPGHDTTARPDWLTGLRYSYGF